MQIVTMKFGGTSVGSGEAISQVVDIVHDCSTHIAEHVVVVVSAMSGVTDLLRDGTLSAAGGDPNRFRQIADQLRDQHHKAAAEISEQGSPELLQQVDAMIDSYLRFCSSVYVLGEATPRALDYTMGLGEQINARLVAAGLKQAGLSAEAVDATELIVTDDRHQNAAPLIPETEERIREVLLPRLEGGLLPVVTGFIGATRDGITTTLGRGGSDYSAALLGTCLGSDEVWIWTDVDGVMSANPKLVPEARSIKRLSYREVSELAYYGAKVLHPKTIRPVIEAGIPLRVKNTFNPAHPGTLILAEHESDGIIKAVTAIPGVSMINVEGKGMLGVPGIAARTFGAVARTETSVLLISQASSEQSICFIVPQESAPVVVEALTQEFEREIARFDIDQIWSQRDITIITVVGAGMRGTPGIAGRLFSAVGKEGINIIAIAQGSSECSISFTVKSDQCQGTLQAIHTLMLEWDE
ncbi:MAG: aspartate kinase [Anaerolineales bacterium]|nr:aspartate kinase [Anaerolineales bacterium]